MVLAIPLPPPIRAPPASAPRSIGMAMGTTTQLVRKPPPCVEPRRRLLPHQPSGYSPGQTAKRTAAISVPWLILVPASKFHHRTLRHAAEAGTTIATTRFRWIRLCRHLQQKALVIANRLTQVVLPVKRTAMMTPIFTPLAPLTQPSIALSWRPRRAVRRTTSTAIPAASSTTASVRLAPRSHRAPWDAADVG